MIEVETKSGFKWHVKENSLRDWRFVHALRDMQMADPLLRMQGVYNMILLVLGEEGEKRLSEHVADEEGFVDAAKMAAEVNEIVLLAKDKSTEIKNS